MRLTAVCEEETLRKAPGSASQGLLLHPGLNWPLAYGGVCVPEPSSLPGNALFTSGAQGKCCPSSGLHHLGWIFFLMGPAYLLRLTCDSDFLWPQHLAPSICFKATSTPTQQPLLAEPLLQCQPPSWGAHAHLWVPSSPHSRGAREYPLRNFSCIHAIWWIPRW